MDSKKTLSSSLFFTAVPSCFSIIGAITCLAMAILSAITTTYLPFLSTTIWPMPRGVKRLTRGIATSRNTMGRRSHPKIWSRTCMLVGANYKGHYVNYYTCGVAMLQTPFFLAAHVLAKPLGYKTDGYSLPYRMGLAISGCFYGLLGLFFLRKYCVFLSCQFSCFYRFIASSFIRGVVGTTSMV